MRNSLFFLLLIALAGCSGYHLAPFATASHWSLNGNTVSSNVRGMTVNFGGQSSSPLSNSSNGEYELNFITSADDFETYAPWCKHYITSALKQIPLAIDSIEFFVADRYIVFSPSVNSIWIPDLIRQADSAEFVVEANPRSSYIQPHDEIWRNYIFDNKLHRIMVVDRFVKNGRHLAIVYIMQSENKHAKMTSTFHYDVTSRRNIQAVGEHMRALLDITIAASESSAQ